MVDGINGGRHRGKWEEGDEDVSKQQIQSECEELAGWCGTGRPKPSREIKFSGANGDRENTMFPVRLTTNRTGNHTRLIHILLKVLTMHLRREFSVKLGHTWRISPAWYWYSGVMVRSYPRTLMSLTRQY